jgi:uncharacterized membrane protein
MPRDVPSERRSWLLQRRDVLSQRQIGLLFATVCAPTLLVAAAFLWWGYWHMLAYAALELGALAACLRYHARHAGDYDRIEISEAAIFIEQRRARRCRRHLFNPWSTRLLPPRRDSDPIRLQAEGMPAPVPLGGFLTPHQKRMVAMELACYLPR